MDSKDLLEDSYCIETELNDVLTLNSCMTIVSELIKFILYRFQQLPYTFDRLKYLVTKKNSKAKQEMIPKIISGSIEGQFKIAEEGLKTLELIFEKIKEELANSSTWCVSEVALLLGSTPMNPKQVCRIHLPEIHLAHSSVNHPVRKHLIHILQSVIMSNKLCNLLMKPMGKTNMYVFIKKNFRSKQNISTTEHSSKWFLPRNGYEIPQARPHFHIKFQYPDSCLTTCCCQNFKIYSDQEEDEKKKSSENSDQPLTASIWYQASAIFQGFTDVYINNVSVADLWLR